MGRVSRRARVAVIIVAFTVLGAVAGAWIRPVTAGAVAPPGVGSVVLTSAADAETNASQPTVNFGTTTVLRARSGSPTLQSFLKFVVPASIGDAAVSAKVRLSASIASSAGGSLRATGNGWSETGITAASAPAATGPALATAGAVASGDWVEFDVSPAVTRPGTYSFVLSSGVTQLARYVSREGAAARRPQLVVSFRDDTAPTVAITNPTAGSVLKGTPTLRATAADVGGVARVQFAVNGIVLGDARANRADYTLAWPVDALPRGTYMITALATDGAGNVATSAPVSVSVAGKKPVVDFTASGSGGAAPVTVRFADRSTGIVTSRTWAFGDGTTSTDAAPVHLYATPKTYRVTLTVGNATGTVTKAMNVVVAPFDRPGRKSGPTRVALVGDSITAFYGSTAAARLTADGYAVTVYGLSAQGILDARWCNGAMARAVQALTDPDIVVLEQLGDYADPAWVDREPPCDPSVIIDTPEFFAGWEREARLQTSIYRAAGARVYWMGNIPVSYNGWRQRAVRLSAIYADVAASTPGVGFFDAYVPFGGPRFDASLRDPETMLHLSATGIDLMSNLVRSAVTAPAPVTPG
jgi:PKD repeat protein